jgi:hypothetical protein
MTDRVSETILLCEDDPQEQLVRNYLKECGLPTEPPRLIVKNASRAIHGGGVHWVIKNFPTELKACRERHATHAKTRLIVVVDADDFTVAERRSHLVADPPVTANDPLVVLIPKRHVETWIWAALNEAVNEANRYKKPDLKRRHIREAAKVIYGWARCNPAPGATCVPSLQTALPEWRKIG